MKSLRALLEAKKVTTTVAATPPTATQKPTAITKTTSVHRALYRSLMKEAKHFDANPLLKTLWPLPKRLMEVSGEKSALYTPSGKKYVPFVRSLFRNESIGDKTDLGFEVLAKMKQHSKFVVPQLPKITRDHAPLMEALEEVHAEREATHHAKLVGMTPKVITRTIGTKVQKKSVDKETGAEVVTESMKPSQVVAREVQFELKVGMGLMAHPLSSAHVDRRAMVIVEKNAQMTTALVLDMLYSYPLSHGNPMFPEVLWGHEVYNGGYCHVDYTMPPTANVALLHTLQPPKREEVSPKEYQSWAEWIKTQAVQVLGESPDKAISPHQDPLVYHERLCKPIIRGKKDGEPTLYYSKVESLPYLASLLPGKPLSSLRVYWGCMKWPTSQITADVINGHWFPVELSPSFFGAYPVKSNNPKGTSSSSTAAAGAAAAGEAGEAKTAAASPPTPSPLPEREPTFPTREELQECASLRRQVSGVDVAPPQTFPPDHPMCRREALWDQVLYSIGGEHTDLVGSLNPFVSQTKSEIGQIPMNADAAGLLAGLGGGPNPEED